MTPVDGITPPKKNSKKKPVRNKVVKKPAPTKRLPKQTDDKPDSKIFKKEPLNTLSKHRLVWIISLVIVFFIFFVWLSLIFGGKLNVDKTNNNNDNFLESFSNNLSETWDNFKKDYLKIRNSKEEEQTEEERIKALEESIFPDFDQYK